MPDPESPLTSKQSGPKWREILDVAATLFYAKGYEATSMQDIAASVGLLKGSLYYYIRTKDDLLYAIMQQAHADIVENVRIIRESDGTPATKLARLINTHITYNLENVEYGAAFMQEFRSLSSHRQEDILQRRSLYEGYVKKLLQQGVADGLFMDRDVGLTSKMLLGSLNAMYLWYKRSGRMTPAEISATVTEMLLRSIRTPEAVDISD